jgi:hypothetical protein
MYTYYPEPLPCPLKTQSPRVKLSALLRLIILRRQLLLHLKIFRRELRKIRILVAGAEHVPGSTHPLDATRHLNNPGYEYDHYQHDIKSHTVKI